MFNLKGIYYKNIYIEKQEETDCQWSEINANIDRIWLEYKNKSTY